jgi:protein TonB
MMRRRLTSTLTLVLLSLAFVWAARAQDTTDKTEADAPPVHAPISTVGSFKVLNSSAVSKPAPEYPAEAKAAGARGTVVVSVVVDEDGNVADAVAVSGPALLRDAAVAAARRAKFKPTFLSGRPVRFNGIVTYIFVLP